MRNKREREKNKQPENKIKFKKIKIIMCVIYPQQIGVISLSKLHANKCLLIPKSSIKL